jgi:serine O-acetyltransferase
MGAVSPRSDAIKVANSRHTHRLAAMNKPNTLTQRFTQVIADARQPLLDSVTGPGDLWPLMREEATAKAAQEPILGSYFHATILNHHSFGAALSFRLASKLDNPMLPTMLIRDVIAEAMAADPDILYSAEIDVLATYTRDPACHDLSTPFLFLKGFHALQAHRVAHWLWCEGRETLAQFFQNQISVTLGIDIHPAAQLGSGIMFDHATGIVIGETAVVEDDVSILHEVTLGGTGKSSGDRHPKIRQGVLLAAGCKVIGNIEVGRNAKVGAGSVVLEDVPPNTTVAGVPAKIVGHSHNQIPAHDMDHTIL